MAQNRDDVPGKCRLDILLVHLGLAESREQAQRLILAGRIEGISNPKPGMRVDPSVPIRVVQPEKYVSRGGLKLEAALREFHLDVAGRVCADIGASTGGFTDCLVQHGASRVYAIDVGRSQMHERIRNNPAVVLIENTNARELAANSLPELVEFVAIDVSFISLDRILAPARAITKPRASAVALVKPQFEAGRVEVSRGRGVIRSTAVHHQVLRKTVGDAIDGGWNVLGLIASPIEGGSGNREFLLRLVARTGPEAESFDIDGALGNLA